MYKKYYPILLTVAFTLNAMEPSEEIKTGIKNLAPTAVVSSASETPIDNVTEIIIEGPRTGDVYYISDDGKYLINGSIIDTTSRKDITEERKSGLRKEVIEKIGVDSRINFYPDDMKYHLTVFTDIDCGYCRKLHTQIDEYNKLGIGISYLFYPRSGLNSPSFDKAQTVWCNDDRKTALTNAKSGVELEPKKCDNPIKDHYLTGQAAGVTGTPALILDDGKLMPGYLPPQDLLNRLTMLEAQ